MQTTVLRGAPSIWAASRSSFAPASPTSCLTEPIGHDLRIGAWRPPSLQRSLRLALGLLALGAGASSNPLRAQTTVAQYAVTTGTATLGSTLTATGGDLTDGDVYKPTIAGATALERDALYVTGSATLALVDGAVVSVQNDHALTALLRVGYPEGGTGTLTIATGATLSVGQASNSANFEIGVGQGSSGTVTQTGGDVRVYGSANVGVDGGAGSYNLSGGTMTLSSGLYSLGLDRTANATASQGTLHLSGSAQLTVLDGSLVIGDSDAAGHQGTGVLTQTGGTLTIGTGALYVGAAGDGTYNLAGGTLAVGGSGLQVRHGGGAAQGASHFNLGGGTIQVVGSDLATDVDATLVSGTASKIDTNGLNATFSGTFTGTNAQLVKIGAGNLALTGAANAIDSFFVTGGKVNQTTGSLISYEIGVGSGAGSTASYTMSSGSLLAASGTPPSLVGGQASTLRIGDFGGTGVFDQTGGTVTVNGSLNLGNQGGHGTYNLSAGTLTLQSSGQSTLGRTNGSSASSGGSTGALHLSGTGVLNVADTATLVLSNWYPTSGIAMGTGVLTQTGGTLAVAPAARLVLTGLGDGTYNLDAGTLQIGGSSLLATYPGQGGTYHFNLGGGTIQVTGSDLTASVDATLTAATTSVFDTNGLNAAWNGALGGSGGLAKIGAGTLLLGGTNTYSGDTLVNAGTLQLGAAGALSPNAKLTVASGATFAANGFAVTLADLGGSGTVDVGTAGLAVAPAGQSTFSGTLAGSGGFTLSGPGTLTLGQASTYAGPTTISAGTLQLGATGALPAGTFVTLSSSATLDLAGHGASLGQLAGTGGTVALNGASLVVGQTGNSTFAGALTGTGGLAKSGAGTLALTGTSTFSGATSISGGELKLNGSAANSTFTVAGGTLSGSGTVGALIIASGGILSPGNSPGTLSAGPTTFDSGGSLLWQIDNASAGGAGTHWDLLSVSGTLALNATAASPFALHLASLTALDAAGPAQNFDPAANYSFTFATASGGISGFSADMFAIVTTDFQNIAAGTWSVASDGTHLSLDYAGTGAIPEPSAWALLVALSALGLAALRRRKARGKTGAA